jgi:hypothetical protein
LFILAVASLARHLAMRAGTFRRLIFKKTLKPERTQKTPPKVSD